MTLGAYPAYSESGNLYRLGNNDTANDNGLFSSIICRYIFHNGIVINTDFRACRPHYGKKYDRKLWDHHKSICVDYRAEGYL